MGCSAVLTAIEDINATIVSHKTIENAVQLINYYITELLRIRNGGVGDRKLTSAHRLIEWLLDYRQEHGPKFSLVEVYQYGPNDLRNKRAALEVVAILEQHGWIVPIDGTAEVRGSKRKQVWELREDIDDHLHILAV